MYIIYIMYKIYKITNDEGQTYYGSTKMDLDKRLKCHKKSFFRYNDNNCPYYTCFDVLKGNNPKIELIEEVEERNKALNKEKEYIKNYDCVNINKPILTDEEKNEYKQELKNSDYFKSYYIKNKEKFQKNYDTNKDKILQQKKLYYQQNKQSRDAYTKEYIKKKKQQN